MTAKEIGRAPTEGRGTPHEDRGTLRRLLPRGRRFLSRRKGVLLRLAGWSLLESVQTFLGGYCLARALDQGFLAGRTDIGLVWLAVAAVAIFVGGPLVRGVFTELASLVEPLRDTLVRRAVTQSLRRAVADPARPDGGAVSRLTHQTEIVRDSFAGLMLTARSFAFTLVGAVAGLLALAPVFLLVILPPLALGLLLFLATLRPMATAQRAFLDADEAIADRVGTVGAGLRDIVACGTGAEVADRTERLFEAGARTSRVLARWAAVRALALGVAGQLPVITLLAATPWLLGHGVTAGALLGALAYLVQALLPALHTLMTALGTAGTRLLVVLERFEDRTADPAPTAPNPPAQPVVKGGVASTRRPRPAVEIRSVTVAYAPGAPPVLDGLDLTVEQGEHLTVVGPSGIGKSTLAGVIAGLLVPDRGTVLLAGEPVSGPRTSEPTRRRVLIPQQAYIFTGTVRDNLRYLRPEASSAELTAAVDALDADGLIGRLGGPDATVEPAKLSQGERQLLALCRAYVSAAPLMILDEATCHLDPVAEARAERALAERPGTLIVIAHRLSSARRADRVLVLDGTRPACGTHEELLTGSALYRDLAGHW
ncbi:ABC transporter ATP-binding protein [Streptomyces sp. MnatMP-M17]|uniref:ATP-binding cassette domain-containing protein n=1 Tax=unclassified Streptomyces TaxID=2593676 RepID=UPI00081D76E1|nr:ABC transporter ATP-binding protein [Streptomyces sp. MnatMP-M17]SCF96262.1 ATP-binding cassette, subfamily C [Streptomyces sp. MnatMP-M17]